MPNTAPLPRLVAFDLDYTLWPLWVDTHVDPPLRRVSGRVNELVDAAILAQLKEREVYVAAASRTCAPKVARQALRDLRVPAGGSDGDWRATVAPVDYFHQMEIYPGSKVTHFREIAKASGVAYKDMIFFDDEKRNDEVARKLGVHFVLVGPRGLDRATFERGLREWRAKGGM
ncbi:protein-tyrosine-phosphatase [Malassezia sp. CBS 17886]|nr:protein-tyrosine-phosphatase [Malassezia sp. CBS 17886]